MFSLFKAYAQKKQLLGFITVNDEDTKKFSCVVIDSANGKTLTEICFEAKDIQNVIGQVPTPENYNGSFKAIVVNLFELNLQSTPFRHTPMDSFCRILKEKFTALELPSYFITRNNVLYSTLLIATDPEIHYDQTVVMVCPRRTTFIVGEFKYTPNGYELIEENFVPIDFKAKPGVLRQRILGSLNPDKIIFAASGCKKKFPHGKIFKGLNLVLFQCCLLCHREKFVAEICKWLSDKTSTKYHIMPTSMKGISLRGCFGSDKHVLDILDIQMGEPLPLTRTANCTKSIPEIHSVLKFQNGSGFKATELPKNCNLFIAKVSIDENNLHEIIFYPGIITNFERVLSIFDAELDSKIPVITFFDNYSVIACQEMDKGYQFLEEWNGKYGTDLFISFDQKKPQFGQTAMEALERKNTFVVFDLLKIMSMPSDDIKAEKHWGFWFTKDDANPVLLEFNTFAGCKKAASPSFLMALYLRQHLKVIKTKTGQETKKIGLCIFDKMNEEENARDGLGKACELLKIDYVFVEADVSDHDHEVVVE